MLHFKAIFSHCEADIWINRDAIQYIRGEGDRSEIHLRERDDTGRQSFVVHGAPEHVIRYIRNTEPHHR